LLLKITPSEKRVKHDLDDDVATCAEIMAEFFANFSFDFIYNKFKTDQSVDVFKKMIEENEKLCFYYFSEEEESKRKKE
jgi:hypothetical protein